MYQTFRGPSGRLEHLEAIYHTQSGQNVVFMDDIESLFPGFTALKKGPVTVAKARDASYKYIAPPCIKYQPDIILEVVVRESDAAAVDSTVAQIPPSSRTYTHPSQDMGKTSSQDGDQSNVNDVQSTLEALTLHSTPAASVPSAIVTVSILAEGAESTEPSPISHRLLQRTQSMIQDSSTQLQVYEQTVQAGKLPQADVIMQGIEALQQELQGNFSILHSEITKNGVLQNQILDMQKAAETMAQRMLELQQRTVQMQRQALDRLALIQNKVSAIMTQTYELHEYPIPRLFIVLPKEDEDSTVSEKLGRGFRNVFVKQFKLYFLCECGEHTKPADITNKSTAANNNNNTTNHSNSDGARGINLKHEVHVARHEGYDLDHPTEFFEKYGPYVLTLLQMLKYGVTIAGVVVAPLAQLSLRDGADAMQKGTDKLFSDMGHRVNNAIEYLQGLSTVPDQSSDRERDGERGISDQLSGLEALEGADLRQLGTFLRNKDDARVFGNLYRIVTSDGHVKWVCLDHYRQNYRSKTMKELKDVVESNDGQYDEHTGRVAVKLASPITARQFYAALGQSRFVNELEIALLWETSLQDLRDLKDAIQHSNVVHLKLTGGGGQGPFSDILNRTRRSDPIIQLMAAGKIRVLSLYDNDGFLERISKVPTYLHIRMLDFGQSRLSTKELKRLAGLVPVSPLLSLLVLRVFDLDEAAEIIQSAVESNKHAAALTLRLAKDESHQATLQFNSHTGNIFSIQLTAPWLQDTRLFLHPAVHSLLITPYRGIATSHGIMRSKELVQTALSRYEALQSLELPCEPYHFHELLGFVRKTASSKCSSLQYLRLCHDDDNQLTTTNLQDSSATNIKLGVISTAGPTDSWDGANSLFKHFGSEIQGLDLDMCLNYTQTERLLQSMKQAQGSKLRQITWRIREPIDPRIFPAMIQILDLSNPSSSTTTSDSTTPWKFTMILDMNRYSDIQLNSSSKASLLDSQMVRDAMANMLIHHVTHLSLYNTDLNQIIGHLKLAGCDGPFDQLRELTIDNQQLYDQGERTARQSQEPLERHATEWIRSLFQRQEDASAPCYVSDDDAITENNSKPTLHRNGYHQTAVVVTSVSFKGVDISPSTWNDLLQSLDFLTLRSLTIFLCNFTDKELSVLIDWCLTTVNETKAIELLRKMDPVSNLTLVEEQAVMNLRSQEGYGVGGQEGPIQVSVWQNQGVSKVHLVAEQERLSRNGVWWCKLDQA